MKMKISFLFYKFIKKSYQGVSGVEFLPVPHKIAHQDGYYTIRYYSNIVLVNTEPSAFLSAQMLKKDLETYAGLTLNICRGKAFGHDIRLIIDNAMPSDHYRLSITPEKACLSAGSDEALMNGVQTFGQYVQRYGGRLPCIEIEDWPDLTYRGYYQDVSRGRVPTLDTLKQTADILCRYKINEWQLYVEHTYLFRELSEAWRDDTPLSAEDIMELDEYCRARHIDLVPSLASFGHMYKILSTKTACSLCELEDSEKQPFSYDDVMNHHTINVSHPCAMKFVKKLISEFMPLFTSRKFNICCDETFDLCKGRSARFAEENGGVQEQYVSFVSELCRWLIEQGQTPQFWGDIIYSSPETYTRIPEGTVCLNWGYSPKQTDETIKVLAEMGATQYACPGMGTWDQWIPLIESSYQNIRLMCKYAHQYGCIGLLNTDWGDFGHICHPVLAIPGLLYGAAFGWNSADAGFEELNSAISFLYYGQREGTFVSTLAKLSSLSLFDWRSTIRYIEAKDPEKRAEILQKLIPAFEKTAENYEAIHAVIDELLSMVNQLQPDKRDILQAICLNAGAMHMFNDVGLYLAANFHGLCGVEYRNGPNLAGDLECWFHNYKQYWRKTCRQSTLHNLQNIINAYADLLRGRA